MSDFVPTFWNTETRNNGSSKTSRISGGQIAYKKKTSDWSFVDNDVQSDLSVTSFPGSVQFPANAQDWMSIEFDGQYSAKRQILEGNWSHSEDPLEMRMRADCPTNATGIIHPDKPWQVIYYNAFGQGVNLIYGIWKGKTSRLEHVIEITEMPPGTEEDIPYSFYIQSNDATTFVGPNLDQRPWKGVSGETATVEGFDVFLAKGDDPSTVRGSVLRTPVCWWKNLDGSLTKKAVRVVFEIQPDGITVKATKYVNRSDIKEALSQGVPYRADVTFNPDASPETTSVDGQTLVTGRDPWADFITKSTSLFSNDSDTTDELRIWCDNSTDDWDQLSRLHFLFDTSSIGAGQQVDSASLDLNLQRVQSDDLGLNWNVYSSSPASNTAIATGDHSGLGTTPFSTARTIVGESISWTDVSMTFNSDGRNHIEMESITKLGVAAQEDREYATYGAPTWVTSDRSQFDVKMAENGTNIPTLTVTHSAAGPAMPILQRHYSQMRAR